MAAVETRPEPAHERRASAHVPRPRLERLLDEVAPGGTALVVAPAGSGKTVLLRQWAARSTAPVAWLSLESAHDDPAILASDLWAACAGAVAGFGGRQSMPVPRGRGLGRLYVDAFVEALESGHEPALLILDDTHLLSERTIVEDLGRLLRRLPPTARAVVASRWDPALSVSALRLDGLLELRAADLSFDVDEAAELVTSVVGRPLRDDLVTTLVDRTGGWSAGLHLASVSLRRAEDPEGFVARFAGDDSLVAEYLTEEVLRHEDEDTRRFLLRTSVLDELDPDLCASVSGQSRTAAMIDDLERRGLFVVPASTPGARRYHHLFARLLRYRLRSEDPDGEQLARHAAAEWHLARDEIRPAVEQLLAAGDAERAFEIVSAQGITLFERGESATLVRWLTRIVDSGVEPRVDIAVALLAAQIAADQFTGAEETYRRLQVAGGLRPHHRASAEALHAASGQRDLPIAQIRRSVDETVAALAEMEADGEPDRSIDFLGIGGTDTIAVIAEHMRGHADLYEVDLPAAKAVFEEVLELPGSRFPIWRISSLGALAVTDALLGLDARSEQLATAAVECATEVGAEHHVSATIAHLALAVIAIDRLDTGAARQSLDRAARCSDQSARPFLHHLRRLQEARLAQLVAGAESAVEILRSPTTPGLERRIARQMRHDLLSRALVRLGRLGEVRSLLRTQDDPHPLVHAEERIASGSFDEASALLAAFDPAPLDVRSRLDLDIHRALLADARGETGAAGEILAAALEDAEYHGLHAPFVESPRALGILRTSAPSRVAPLVEMMVAGHLLDGSRDTSNAGLVDPLTDREMGVLEYLPSRLSNTEIAGTLYISVNTLKTHLRNIYRKLDATDRDSAVAEASKLGLL